MTKTLYVGNLAREISEDRLRDLFAGDGRGVEAVSSRSTARPASRAASASSRWRARKTRAATSLALNGTDVEGRALKVGGAAREKGATAAKSGGYEDDYGGGGGHFGSGGGGGRRGRR